MLGMLQALIHYVTINRYKNVADRMNHENLSTRKIFTRIIFNENFPIYGTYTRVIAANTKAVDVSHLFVQPITDFKSVNMEN